MKTKKSRGALRRPASQDFPQESLPAQGPNRSVLVVDDEPAVLSTVGMVLRRCGYQPTLARSGEEGLAAVRDGFRGVVLMDVMMPGLNGWETIRALVKEHLEPGLLICMLTGEPAGTDGEGLEQFVFDYVSKPFRNSELIQMVENAIGFLES